MILDQTDINDIRSNSTSLMFGLIIACVNINYLIMHSSNPIL